jgi:hypothetical protein
LFFQWDLLFFGEVSSGSLCGIRLSVESITKSGSALSYCLVRPLSQPRALPYTYMSHFAADGYVFLSWGLRHSRPLRKVVCTWEGSIFSPKVWDTPIHPLRKVVCTWEGSIFSPNVRDTLIHLLRKFVCTGEVSIFSPKVWDTLIRPLMKVVCIGERPEYRPFHDLRSVHEAGRPREQVENQRRACTQVLILRKAELGFFHFLEIVTG